MIHSSLRTFVGVVGRFLTMSLFNPCNVSTRSSGYRLSFICVVGRCPIKSTLAHIAAPSFRSDLQGHIVDIMTRNHLLLLPDYHNIVACVLICLKSIRARVAVVALVILGVVSLLLLLLLIDCITKDTLVGTVHSSCLWLHKGVFQSIVDINTWLTMNLSRMVVGWNLVVNIHIWMLVSESNIIAYGRIGISSKVALWFLVWTSNWKRYNLRSPFNTLNKTLTFLNWKFLSKLSITL